MTLTDLAKTVQKFTIDNSPLILTAIGATGVLGTAYLAARGGIKAGKLIEFKQDELDRVVDKTTDFGHRTHQLTLKEKANLTWKFYLPAFAVGTVTLAAVVGANQIGTKRMAGLAAAYSLSQTAFEEYKTKVIHKLGDRKEESILAEVAQDRLNGNPIGNREVIVAGNGAVDCYDPMSGRYFKSSAEEIKAAQNHVNYLINGNGYAALNDFYDRLGLDRINIGDEVGWRSEKLLEVKLVGGLSDKMTPVLSLEYATAPVRDYYRFR